MYTITIHALQQQTTKNWGKSEAQYVSGPQDKKERFQKWMTENNWIGECIFDLQCKKFQTSKERETNIAQFEKQSKKFDKPKFSRGRNWYWVWARQRQRQLAQKVQSGDTGKEEGRTLIAYQVFRRPLRVEILYVLITFLILVFPPAFVGSHTTSPLSVKQLGLGIFISD